MTRARTVWFERAGVAAVRDEELGPLADDEAIFRGTFSGVSAGTERVVLGGRVPPESHGEMALAAMRGTFDLPCAYGYAFVGRVEMHGASFDAASCPGDVFALHPHADRARLTRAAVRPLPSGLPGPRLTLAANLETAVNVVWDAEIALGDRVVVAGLGVVGLLVAKLAARAGARVVGVDPDVERRRVAGDFGVEATAAASSPLLHEADVLIEVSGAPESLAVMVANAGTEARIVVASWYGNASVPLPLGAGFHARRLTLRSSQVARVAASRRARWDHDRRFALVTDLLADDALDVLIAPPIPLTEAPTLYAELARGASWSPPHRVFDLTR